MTSEVHKALDGHLAGGMSPAICQPIGYCIANVRCFDPRSLLRTREIDRANGTRWFGCSGGLFRFEGTTIVNVTKNGPWR